MRRYSRRRPRLLVEILEDRINLSAGIGIFDASTATWSLRSSASPGNSDVGLFQYGLSGQSTVPVVGDWNGDQIDDIGTFNKETATWSLRFGASEGLPDAGVFQFGGRGDIPVVGDWNGDGRDDIGTFDPRRAVWSLRFGASAGPANAGNFRFGVRDSLPVVGDWDGDGTDGIGSYSRGSTTWTLRHTASAGVADAGAFRFGVRRALPVVGDWNGDGVDGIGTFVADTANWTLRNIAAAGAADVGTFQLGTAGALPIVGDFVNPAPGENTILNLSLEPLDIDLLGLKVQSSPITVTVSADVGDGKLLGNLLTTVDQVLNLDEINSAVNSVLGATVDLLNSATLAVEGVGSGVFDEAAPSATQVLELFVAPVNLDLMGAIVTTSPIRLSVSAQTGDGLVLGNVLTVLSDLSNDAPAPLDLDLINDRLTGLLDDLRAQLPNFSSVEVPPPTLAEGDVLALTVPAIDLDLLGLMLKTTPISVDVSSREGDGLLLGNVLSSALSTLGATPAQLSELSGHVNNTLNYIVAVLNNTSLTLSPGAVDQLSQFLQQLTLPDLVTAEPGQTAKILDLVIAQPDGSPPVNVDLLGLNVQVGNIDAELSARTGEGQILGNLLYNVANLVNSGGTASLIDLLTQLGGGTTSNLGDVTVALSPTADDATAMLTLTVPPLDIDLLGVEVKTTEPITVTVSALEGDGLLLGNVLTAVSSLLNTDGISSALNNVLDTVVGILNNLDLVVDGIGSGVFDTAPTSVTPIADLLVAPVQLDLLGALVETSQIHLTITAFAGEGLVLGNALTALSDLFNNPPEQLDLNFINTRLEELLTALNQQIPTPNVEPATPPLGEGDILALTVPALDIDLLGLALQTNPITVNASATTGDGLLLGNVLTSVLTTLDATPDELTRLNSTLNTILAKVFAVLNGATSLLPADLPGTLSEALPTLSLSNLIAAEPGATATILDLTLTDSSGIPVSLDALGLLVTTSNIDVTLSAHTGEGQILGNLLYNIANLLNPDSSLLSLLLLLGLSGDSQPSASTFDVEAAEIAGQVMLPGVNVVDGRLLVGGGSANDVLVITGVGSGTTGEYEVVFNGVSHTISGVSGDIEIDLFGGDDQATINNAYVNGSIDIDMESGHDSVTLGSQRIVSTRLALSVLLGDGNDKLAGQRLYIGGSQSVSGEDGNDQILFLGSAGPGPFVLGTSSGGATSISGGPGNDRISATYSFVVGTWQFVGSLGEDVISVRTSACISGVTVFGDVGVDTLVVDTNFFLATLLMEGGADADLLELRNSLGLLAATLDAGAGDDVAYVSNLTASRLSLILGAQHDTADVRGSLFDEIFAHLGDQNDSLTLYGNLVRRASSADGGAGGDAFFDLGNTFLRGLRRVGFEG